MTDQTYLADWNRMNPMDTEKRLKGLLHGKRLVGELDLTPEENVFQMSRWVFNGFVKPPPHIHTPFKQPTRLRVCCSMSRSVTR